MKRLTQEQEQEQKQKPGAIVSVAQGVMLLVARGGDGEPPASPSVFECKTCSRRFPSFQALGGHRASHKRLRPAEALGVKFALGQALGGHMRRHHRAVAEECEERDGAASAHGMDVDVGDAEAKPEEEARGLLGFDLNIAPS